MVPRNDLGYKKEKSVFCQFSDFCKGYTLWYKIGRRREGSPILLKFCIDIAQTHINAGRILKRMWLMHVANEQGGTPQATYEIVAV